MKPKIIIIGAGGHGKVLCDAILQQKKYHPLGFLDGSMPKNSDVFLGLRVLGRPEEAVDFNEEEYFFIVGIGDNKIREGFYNRTRGILKAATVVHPSAVINEGASLGEGTVVLANAVIGANCKIGENTIVNAGVVIDHDCFIGNNVHLSIGTLVGSNCEVGPSCKTAIGKVLEPFSKLK